MKKSIFNILTGIVLLLLLGSILLMGQIYKDPYSMVNPYPPPTVPVRLILPTHTSTLARMPATWTVTPSKDGTYSINPSSTPWGTPTKAQYVVIRKSTSTPTIIRTQTATSAVVAYSHQNQNKNQCTNKYNICL